MSQDTPVEMLDRALECKPGVGVTIEFHAPAARERFRWRLYAAMSTDARRSTKLDDPASAGWGRHRWGTVQIDRVGDTALWVGRAHEFTISSATPMPSGERDG